MKKIILLISILIILFSCAKRGEIIKEPIDFIEINGKIYKLIKVVPADGYNSIWIMYPKDGSDKIPTSINYNVKEGKNTINETIIKVD